jgi:predicted ArsR family transcriptional regulator
MIYHRGWKILVNTRQEILDFLKKQDWPSTTEDIADKLKISWNTAQVHLLKMVNESIVRYKKVGRQNQFWLTKNYKKYFK